VKVEGVLIHWIPYYSSKNSQGVTPKNGAK